MFSIKIKGEDRIVHALIQNIADIPGGVTVAVADLVPNSILKEGTVIGFDEAGIAHVIKSASVAEEAAANATTIKISKGSNLKAGDFVTDGKGAAVAVASIDTNSSNLYDTITITPNDDAGFAKLVQGAVITLAKTASKTAAALKFEPVAMVADSYEVKPEENLWVPAVVMGTFKKSLIPPVSADVLAKLKGIILL